MTLYDFIVAHDHEIIRRAQMKVALRTTPLATPREIAHGVPLFLKQLCDVLRQEADSTPVDAIPMEASATLRGSELLRQGFTIAQVVYDYGDLCQAITDLALEMHLPIGTEDFQTLNRCLDDAIAGAVTEYARQGGVDAHDAELRRKGFFAHELRNHLGTAMLAFQVVRSGRVGFSGSTIEVLERSLRGLRDLIDRSMSEVRLSAGTHQRERLPVALFLDEMESNTMMEATNRGLRFQVERGEDSAFVDVDRHLFASAISNLVQNAFKFTRPSSRVWLRAQATEDRVTIEIEDECGGMAAGAVETIFASFEQRDQDRGGLGLGLAICRQALAMDGGTVTVRNMPGKGCVFIVEVPRSADPSLAELVDAQVDGHALGLSP